jgi:starch phosphorylase
MRESMARLTPRFSANRMVREYTERYYLRAAAACRRRCAERGKLGTEIAAWQQHLAEGWCRLRFGALYVIRSGSLLRFDVQVYLDNVEPTAVEVELYAEPLQTNSAPTRVVMERERPLPGAVQGFLYTVTVETDRSAGDFTPRILPNHAEAAIPLEAAMVLWQR